ncbi:MAG: hypothetical protein RIQ52_1460 [Pseudomonadota bacterium]
MDSQNIFYRLRSGLALVAGVLGGRYAALRVDESQYSTYFIGGFILSYLLSHFIFFQAKKLLTLLRKK